MKNLLLVLAWSVCLHVTAQVVPPKDYPTTVPNLNLPDEDTRKAHNQKTWKTVGMFSLATVLAGVSGVSQGVHETTLHDYPAFKRQHPNAKDLYWDPEISWRNKWKNGDKNQGPAFFGSTTIFVPFTDGYHTTNAVDRATTISGSLVFGIGSKDFLPKWKDWQRFAAGFVYVSLVKSAAFNLTYHGFYGRPR